jgi:catechol 2,3-dioxygenase-like lactoylglutathione lyase family enzyme
LRQHIGLTTVVVSDYDEAIAFYVGVLGFTLVEDTYIAEQNKRWVVVSPRGATESRLLIAKAVGAEQSSRIGNQTGGRVMLFLYTDDFWRDYRLYQLRFSVICTAIYGTCWNQRNDRNAPAQERGAPAQSPDTIT